MIGLYIFLGIILLIFLALFLSVSVTITYETTEGEEDSLAIYKIHYGPFKIFPKSSKKKSTKNIKKIRSKKPKKAKNKKEPIKSTGNLDSKSPNTKESKIPSPKIKTSLNSDEKTKKEKIDFELIKSLIKSAIKPVTRLFGKIRITSLSIHCIAGGEDAAKVAINYGIYCTAVYGLTTWLGDKIKVGINELKISADFDRKETYLFIRMKIKLSVAAAVIHFLWFLKRFSTEHSKVKKSQAKGKEK